MLGCPGYAIVATLLDSNQADWDFSRMEERVL